MNYPLDPALGTMGLACFALLFAAAALHKLLEMRHFAAVLDAYGVLPAMRAPLWGLIPLLEFGVAAALLCGRWRAPAATGGACLLLVYAAAMALNLWRGRRALDCGCVGFGKRRVIAWWMVWRNVALAAGLALAGLAPWNPRGLVALDWLTIAAGAAVLVLLYGTVEVLLESAGSSPGRVTVP